MELYGDEDEDEDEERPAKVQKIVHSRDGPISNRTQSWYNKKS